MAKYALWLPIIGLLSLLVMGQTMPASARGGLNRFGMAGFEPRTVMRAPNAFFPKRISTARHVDIRNDLLFHRHGQSRIGLPITIWPYVPYFDNAPAEVAPNTIETPVEPQVIVLSESSHAGAEPVKPETPPDFSYVTGCRAIANGYHCDNHQNETAP